MMKYALKSLLVVLILSVSTSGAVAHKKKTKTKAKAVPAKILFGKMTTAADVPARAFGSYAKGCFAGGVQFARSEGIVAAPEANHAIKVTIDEALKCKEEGVGRTILFNLSGHGHFDMQAYTDYFDDKLVDQNYDEQELAMALAGLPSVSAA